MKQNENDAFDAQEDEKGGIYINPSAKAEKEPSFWQRLWNWLKQLFK